MQLDSGVLSAASAELDAAILQAAVALGLAAYTSFLYGRYHKDYFLGFAATWLLYTLRIGAISAFLLSGASGWLYWHQVLTGWTALSLLWAALAFSRQLPFRRRYLAALLFPLGWSYVAIYVLDNFLSAALLAVGFLSVVTALAGWVFLRHWQRVRAPGALLLAVSLALWALHHLDYPFLRARGSWIPWGYYLDIAFLLATAAGMTVLVLDDLREGLAALTALAGGVRDSTSDAVLDALLVQAESLPAARGAAFCTHDGGELQLLRGSGECASWTTGTLTAPARHRISQMISAGKPQVVREWQDLAAKNGRPYPCTVVLPVAIERAPTGALVMVGDARDPFGALDERFLVALGRQIGSALAAAELTRRLRERGEELARLSTRMVRQHEEERRRLSRELHDETAQVFSAVKLQLGVLKERSDGATAQGLSRALELVDTGIRSIRNVTETLRPAVLDELGLVPALRSLAADTSQRCGLRVDLEAPPALPPLTAEAELALFRAMQESLSNVVRHAGARSVHVGVTARDLGVELAVRDDGHGMRDGGRSPAGGMGLTGMRERIAALGGQLSVASAGEHGTEVRAWVPAGSA